MQYANNTSDFSEERISFDITISTYFSKLPTMKRLIFISVILLVLYWPSDGNCKGGLKAVATDIRIYHDKNDECFVKVSLKNNGKQKAYIECRSLYSVHVRDSNLLQNDVTIVIPGYSAIKLIRGKDIPWSSIDMAIFPPADSLWHLKYQNFLDGLTSCVDAVKTKRINGKEYYVCYPNQSIAFYCTVSFDSKDVMVLLKTLERRRANIDAIYLNLGNDIFGCTKN